MISCLGAAPRLGIERGERSVTNEPVSRAEGDYLVARRGGFTLVETMVVVVVIGLVSLIALPNLQNAWAHSSVLSAKSKVTSLYYRARSTAVESSRTAILVVSGGNAYLVARPRQDGAAGVDTVTRVENVYTQFQVNLTSDADSIRVAPTGLGINGANLVLTKGSYADTVSINQYGRILK
jgi:prepilin-type N-terminal cleavage/methylation domain-containing protein